jgi:SAM-dependent methyltransferase
MSVFGNYARYYDLLYREKDYGQEVAFVVAVIRKRCPDARCILDLGCGTGEHARFLAELGICVHGVDSSASMLERARLRQQGLPPEVARKLIFSRGDVKEVRLGRTFDGIVSLFHVLSYQTRNDEIRDMLATAREHLRPGGVFVFDCWYGPAVLTDRPTVRVKRVEDDAISVTRIAEPEIHPNRNIVDVKYTILVQDKVNREVKELKEVHRMRYLFFPEIEMFATLVGLKIVGACEWMKDNELGLGTWNACFIAQG